jgi:membrane protein YdbS with pleckstrin-like domain
MSKRQQKPPRIPASPAAAEQRRQELEWLYSEENEQKLETWRNVLIFLWLLCSFAAAFLLADQTDILVWSSSAGVFLVIAYQVHALWLGKVAEDRIDTALGKRKKGD